MGATTERIRAEGFVYRDVLNTPEIKAVALPVTGLTGHPFAGLSITAMASRIPADRAPLLLDRLRQEIDGIAQSIAEQGYV